MLELSILLQCQILIFLVDALEFMRKKPVSMKLRQIETDVRLRQICSINIMHSTKLGNYPLTLRQLRVITMVLFS